LPNARSSDERRDIAWALRLSSKRSAHNDAAFPYGKVKIGGFYYSLTLVLTANCYANHWFSHQGKPPSSRRAQRRLELRPWLHISIPSALAVVVSIGSEHRGAFTIVGDSVNTAQRLEQDGKVKATWAEGDVTILLGEAMAAGLPKLLSTRPCVAKRTR
jgi:hypothetical protein